MGAVVAHTVDDDRPDNQLTAKLLSMVEVLAAHGVAKAAMADALRMSLRDFRRELERNEVLQDAIERGEPRMHDRLVAVVAKEAESGKARQSATVRDALAASSRDGVLCGVDCWQDTAMPRGRSWSSTGPSLRSVGPPRRCSLRLRMFRGGFPWGWARSVP